MPVVLADLMRGTGRYNVSRGVIATMQGIGASLSNTVAGVIVVKAGYTAAFLSLAAVALIGLICFLIAMPETRRAEETFERNSRSDRARVECQVRHYEWRCLSRGRP